MAASMQCVTIGAWDQRDYSKNNSNSDDGDNNNNGASRGQYNIHARSTPRAQKAAILLPSFRSPDLCNYDFIFMDINCTGCLAVSLYGILIQGCRHNGNPRRGLTAHLPAEMEK